MVAALRSAATRTQIEKNFAEIDSPWIKCSHEVEESLASKFPLTKTLTSHGRSKRPTSPHTHLSFACFVFFAGAGAARFGVGVAAAFDAPPSLWAAYASAIFAMFAFEATSCATIGLG